MGRGRWVNKRNQLTAAVQGSLESDLRPPSMKEGPLPTRQILKAERRLREECKNGSESQQSVFYDDCVSVLINSARSFEAFMCLVLVLER